MIRARVLCIFLAMLSPLALAASEVDDAVGNPEHDPACPARVSFLELRDGDVVPETFTVQFVATGMDVVPAGVEAPHSGHHHLLIDVDTLPPLNLPLPKTEHIVHFGGGETSTTLTLPPGQHTLQLLLGDALHIPHNPPVMSPRITVTVSPDADESE